MQINERQALHERVNSALDTVRPHLAIDGGDVEIVDVTDDFVVRIKWLGNCQGCNMSEMTLRAGLEQAIKNSIPEIKAVEEWSE
jgi:Fe-S cluster biogenesis protein NfuA